MVKEGLNYLVTRTTQELVKIVSEDNNIPVEETMDIVYNSKTFELLCDLETHLYYESPAYVYELLKEELEKNQKRISKNENSPKELLILKLVVLFYCVTGMQFN